MRRVVRALVALLALFLCAACVAVGHGRDAEPDIHLIQITPHRGDAYLRGPIDIEYELIIRNRSDERLYLTAVELRSAGGGTYSLRPQTHRIRRVVPPYETTTVHFWAHAWFRGGVLTSLEPVNIRGVARLETRRGVWHSVFFETLP
jgi:hypothetical protein